MKRVQILKENGKMGNLGILTVTDRIIQQAIVQAISQIFEKNLIIITLDLEKIEIKKNYRFFLISYIVFTKLLTILTCHIFIEKGYKNG